MQASSFFALVAVAAGLLGGCAASEDCENVDGGSPDAGVADCDNGEDPARSGDDAFEPTHIFDHVFP